MCLLLNSIEDMHEQQKELFGYNKYMDSATFFCNLVQFEKYVCVI